MPVVALCAAFFTFACSSDDGDSNTLAINDQKGTITLNFDNNGTGETVSLLSTLDWSVVKPAWVKVSPSSGVGKMETQLVTISATINQEDAREGNVIFKMTDGQSLTVMIKQAAGSVLEERTTTDIVAQAFSRNGRYLAAVQNGQDNWYVWDMFSSQTAPKSVTPSRIPNGFGVTSVTDDGRVFPYTTVTPNGKMALALKCEGEGASEFFIPMVVIDGQATELPCNDKDIYGVTREGGYKGNKAYFISDDGKIIAGAMITSKNEYVACYWMVNAWSYEHRLVSESTTDICIASLYGRALSPDGKYFACTDKDLRPMVYNIETHKRETVSSIGDMAAMYMGNDGVLFYLPIPTTGRSSGVGTSVYENGVSTPFSAWMTKRYGGGESYEEAYHVVGTSADLSYIAWVSYGNAEARNFVIRPYNSSIY